MGFFSWRCAKCNQPVLNVYAVGPDTRRLCEVVVLVGKRVISGFHDGYGRVGDYEIPCGDDPVILHRCCHCGERGRDLPRSKPDEGQGFFYTKEEVHAIHQAVLAACTPRPERSEQDSCPP